MVISSSPSPCTTQARSQPRSRAPAPAARSIRGENTPSNWRLHARRIGQRAEQVENRPRAKFDPRRADMAHGRMMRRREHEADAGLADAGAIASGPSSILTPSAVSTSAAPDCDDSAAIAVLGDRHAAAGHDEGRGGRDIARAGGVAAGADDVDRAFRRVHRQHLAAHGRDGAGDFVAPSRRARAAPSGSRRSAAAVPSPDMMMSNAVARLVDTALRRRRPSLMIGFSVLISRLAQNDRARAMCPRRSYTVIGLEPRHHLVEQVVCQCPMPAPSVPLPAPDSAPAPAGSNTSVTLKRTRGSPEPARPVPFSPTPKTAADACRSDIGIVGFPLQAALGLLFKRHLRGDIGKRGAVLQRLAGILGLRRTAVRLPPSSSRQRPCRAPRPACGRGPA